MKVRLIYACLLLFVVIAPAYASDDVPAWLQEAASATAPAYAKDVPAVVLRREQHVTVNDDGRVTTITTYAVRILLKEGRDYAHATEVYNSDSGKVREMKAWLLRPDGPIRKYGKDDIVDAIEDSNDVYNESRVKFIDASKDAGAGCVFGYQVTSEERTIFSQTVWGFQSRLPAVVSRYSITLPQGWEARGVIFNHAPFEPTVSGSTYTWELKNLAPIAIEPNSPRSSSLEPRLAVSFLPPATAPNSNFKTFSDWTEVSSWLAQLHDPQSNPDGPLTAKVRQLTAGANTEWDKIKVIGRYVQDIKYISIDVGVNRGGGMRPHMASEVFAKSYGDCKDKANLMRAMLRAVDITAYPVIIYSGDPDYVREQWVSPLQFNHCIIAIKVSDATQAATVISHPKLGRLLIFDPTDDDTPLGDLPDHEQGSFALVVATDAGALMKMPATPSETNLLDRKVEASLDADGSLSAVITQVATGTWAVDFRREFRHLSRPDFEKSVNGWVNRGVNAAKIGKVEPSDNGAGNFDLKVDFTAPAYAQLMQNRLLVFKPAIVSRRNSVALTEPTRQQPIVIKASAYSETVRVKLPAGFDVDELPDPVKLDTPFGSYTTSYEVKDAQLVFTRKLVQRSTTLPVDQYNAVRNFYARIVAAEQSPVVLTKK